MAELPAWVKEFTASVKRPPAPAERDRWYHQSVFILREWAKDFFKKNPAFASLLNQPGAIRLDLAAPDRLTAP